MGFIRGINKYLDKGEKAYGKLKKKAAKAHKKYKEIEKTGRRVGGYVGKAIDMIPDGSRKKKGKKIKTKVVAASCGCKAIRRR